MTYKHLPSPHGRETDEGDATAHKAHAPPVLPYLHVEISNFMTLSLTSDHSSQPQVHIIDDSTFENTFQCLHYRPTLHAKILKYYLQGIHQYLPHPNPNIQLFICEMYTVKTKPLQF